MIQEIMQFISKHPILTLVWFALFIAMIILIFKDLFAKIGNISHTQAIQLINKEEAITIDLRSCNDFRKGHIVDSINLTPSEIEDNHIRELEKYKQKPIIVISTNGIEAYKPARQLVQYGFKRVFLLKKGIAGWSSENLPLTTSYSKK